MAVADVFETSSDLMLVLELCREGTLLDFLTREAERARTYQGAELHLSEAQALFVLHQLLDALAYLHAGGTRVAHLNLQPEALMVKTRPNHLQDASWQHQPARNQLAAWQYLIQLKLGGFNRACCLLDRAALAAAAEDLEQCARAEAPEELEFLAPELLRGNHFDRAAITTSCDLWPAGLVALLILTGRSLLYRESADAARDALRTLGADAIAAQLAASSARPLSSETRALLARLLQPEPERRASAEELARDALFANLSTHSDPPDVPAPPPDAAAAANSEPPDAIASGSADAVAASRTSVAAGWERVASRRKTFFTLKEVLPKRQGTEKRRRKSTRSAPPPLAALELGGTAAAAVPQESNA